MNLAKKGEISKGEVISKEEEQTYWCFFFYEECIDLYRKFEVLMKEFDKQTILWMASFRERGVTTLKG